MSAQEAWVDTPAVITKLAQERRETVDQAEARLCRLIRDGVLPVRGIYEDDGALPRCLPARPGPQFSLHLAEGYATFRPLAPVVTNARARGVRGWGPGGRSSSPAPIAARRGEPPLMILAMQIPAAAGERALQVALCVSSAPMIEAKPGLAALASPAKTSTQHRAMEKEGKIGVAEELLRRTFETEKAEGKRFTPRPAAIQKVCELGDGYTQEIALEALRRLRARGVERYNGGRPPNPKNPIKQKPIS